jgi:hypothetical protein
MIILPGLTSTKKERISDFVNDMRYFGVSTIALFPTCLDMDERLFLYRELESFPGIFVPHVHLRSDCRDKEIDYLRNRFGVQVFNVHPRASKHPFMNARPDQLKSIFVENVEQIPESAELEECGGICPDFSHWKNAMLLGKSAYDGFKELFQRFRPGCCHLSALRLGDPNDWSGEWDHHYFKDLSDFDYLAEFRDYLPSTWLSLEVENPLSEQLEAIRYIEKILA